MSNTEDKPVAYDTQGRPLFHRPTNTNKEPQAVHVVKAIEPEIPQVSEEILVRHQQSSWQFPEINLSEGEYVINHIRRHPLGLVTINLATISACFLAIIIWWYLLVHPGSEAVIVPPESVGWVSMIMMGLVLFALAVGAIAGTIYRRNKFFLTNESVIQHIQTSLFSQNDQIVSLANIEDASYSKTGIFQTLFNYGSIRLSTQGDETTYKFHWVADPKKQIDQLNNTVESFKNGRPIEET